MSSDSDGSPLEDIQNFLNNFKDKYGNTIDIESEYIETEPQQSEPQSQNDDQWELEFDYTPEEIKEHLDRYVIGQEEAKKHLSNAVCYHYHQTQRDDPHYQKKNILMIGNTGVGKTHLVEILSDYIGIPFVKADATKFSGTGYIGKNVSSLIRELAEKVDNNLELAEHGIIFIDEIDKICSSDDVDRDVSGHDVQTNLLKLLEETEVNLMDPSNPMSMMQGMRNMFGEDGEMDKTVNTSKILFIVSGAFPGLEEIITKRLNRGGIGFNADVGQSRDVETLRHCSTQDLTDYGLEDEFVGRLPVRTFLDDLDEGDLYRILLESESSVLRQYERDFQAYGIDLHLTDEALREIASRAKDENIGARGLTSVLENVFFEFMHTLPDHDISELTVDKATVENPSKKLNEILLENELDDYLENNFQENGTVTVTQDARRKLIEIATSSNSSPIEVFKKRFDSLNHIMSMIECDNIEIDEQFVRNHEEELDKLCSDYYQQN